MNSIDRRRFLKILSVAGSGTALAGILLGRNLIKFNYQFYIITEDPEQDVAWFLGHISSGQFSFHINKKSIPPTSQDLSIIRDGKVVDPLGEECNQPALKKFTYQLRNRQSKGHVLVTVTPAEIIEQDQVTFEVNGRIVEQVDRTRNYKSIVVPGHQGKTEFKVEDEIVSVVNSSCRYKICQRMGNIESGRIICAPNKLLVAVRQSRQSNHTLDSITC